MNNLAATLLLTHATEEEAFWVLVMIIEVSTSLHPLTRACTNSIARLDRKFCRASTTLRTCSSRKPISVS